MKNHMIKKLLIAGLSLSMLIGMTACGSSDAKDTNSAETAAVETEAETSETAAMTEETDESEEELLGAYEITASPQAALSEKIQAIFDQGMTLSDGVAFTPVALLGTQLVAGTNYCFLAQSPENNYYTIVIYQNLDGEVTDFTAAEIDFTAEDYKTIQLGLAGGWEIALDTFAQPEEEMTTRVEEAASTKLGADYELIAVLGSQIVAGTNYKALCKVTPVTPTGTAQYALVTVYEDLEGNLDITDVVDLTEELTEAKKEKIVQEIVYDHQYHPGEYAVITAYDADGNVVWTYETEIYTQGCQMDYINEVGMNGDRYYLTEKGCVLCFDSEDGTLLWKNEDYIGALAGTGFAFGEDGTLYITGYLGPDLCVIDVEGNTLARVDSFDSSIYWPYDCSLEGNELTIYFENPFGNDPITEVINIEDYTRIR